MRESLAGLSVRLCYTGCTAEWTRKEFATAIFQGMALIEFVGEWYSSTNEGFYCLKGSTTLDDAHAVRSRVVSRETWDGWYGFLMGPD